MAERDYTLADRLISHFDRGLRTVFGHPPTTGRPYPAADVEEAPLSAGERREAARLMRVNHCGEVCAQALYQGQSLTARDGRVGDAMRRAADEENDHLAWCETRIRELGGHRSYLNPLFYGNSLAVGALAGVAGDRWSLGFLAETERQVVRHLEGHLGRLPAQDARSRVVVDQMKTDEGQHATMALEAGGAKLPAPARGLMRLSSKVMTKTTYWV